VALQNLDIADEPVIKEEINGQNVTERRSVMDNIGERAYEAAAGVTLTVGISWYTLLRWRRLGRGEDEEVKVTTSWLGQFFFRGTTLAIVVAVVLEGGLNALLRDEGIEEGFEGFNMLTLLEMGFVGFAEEFAKLFAVTCATCLTVSALSSRGSRSCCTGCFPVLLVESRRALALAGLASGFGLMTVENIEYLITAASQPPRTLVEGYTKVQITGTLNDILTAITTFIRVVLNIHPWLTGLSALRLGRVVFSTDSSNTLESACVGPKDFLMAMAPSMIIHAAYDFLISSGVDLFGVFLPFIFWCWSYRLFQEAWREAAEAEYPFADPDDEIVKEAAKDDDAATFLSVINAKK
jgi:RsiW-degrading membrane proteinase PrsW (M82 family)